MDTGFYVNHERTIVIIGGGASGGTAAQFARKTDRKASITIFEKGRYPQHSKCGLPYTISGDVPSFNDLIEFSEDWFKKEHIDLYLDTFVERVDLEKHVVIARKGNESIEKPFDSLIIATGAQPWIPPINNLEKQVQGVYVLRTIDDGKYIASSIKKGGNATIIGAGLIGLEMADSLTKKGMKVTVVEALPTILANTLDPDMSETVVTKLQEKITISTNYLATSIEEKNGSITSVHIKNRDTNEEHSISTNLLVIAAGCKPDVFLGKTIGCVIGKTGGIIVNEKAETSVQNVFAVGDCSEYKDFITNEPVGIGLGSIGVRQGIAAGINAAGGIYTLPQGVLLSRTSEFFGLEIAAVGPTQQLCQKFSVISGKFKGLSKPEYFPGGEPITIKILVDEKTGRILSAQAVGSNAAQRINVFACAILKGTTVEEMKKLETAYAPPIAPTLDAITLVCDVVSLKLSRKSR